MKIAFIPVRGGSKSIPLKNIKDFCGKPLVYWTVKAAVESKLIDKVIVSTDHNQIRSIVESFEFPNVIVIDRKEENSRDISTTESVILEFLEENDIQEEDTFILIQATSPCTEGQMLDEGINLFLNGEFDSIVSGTRFKRFLWDFNGEAINYDYMKRPRRQDFKGLFLENGAFYISKVKEILKNKNRISGRMGLYEMPEYTSIEIDEIDDWKIVEKLFIKYSNCHKPINAKIKLVLSDVDGVLTDSGMYYSENGDELKKFNTRDGMGFELLRKAGIKTGIITSENTLIVKRRAEKLGVDYLFQGKREGGKLNAALEICEKESISIENVAYLGDDINCLHLLDKVGFAACPADADSEVKAIKDITILNKNGGHGVFREFVQKILNL